MFVTPYKARITIESMEYLERFDLIHKMRNFVHLSPEEEVVLGSLQTRQEHFACRSLVYAEQTPVADSYIVKDGWFATFTMLANGKRILTNLHLPGDMIGIDSLPCARHISGLMCLTAGSLYVFTACALERVLDSSPGYYYSCRVSNFRRI